MSQIENTLRVILAPVRDDERATRLPLWEFAAFIAGVVVLGAVGFGMLVRCLP